MMDPALTFGQISKRPMRRFMLLILPALFIINRANAQDYVVNSTNDTLRGGIKIFTYDVTDRVEVGVKEGTKTKKKSLTAIQLKEVFLEGKIYHPQFTNDGYRLLQLKTAGYLSLYLAHHPKANLFEIPCLVKRGGKFLEVPGFGFKKMVSTFLNDCPKVSGQIQSGQLGARQLDQIISEFNTCIEEQTVLRNLTPTSVLAVGDPKLVALNTLITHLEKDTELASRKDVLDLTKDINQKALQKQPIPPYLIEALKTYLKDAPAYQEDLNKVIEVLK